MNKITENSGHSALSRPSLSNLVNPVNPVELPQTHPLTRVVLTEISWQCAVGSGQEDAQTHPLTRVVLTSSLNQISIPRQRPEDFGEASIFAQCVLIAS